MKRYKTITIATVLVACLSAAGCIQQGTMVGVPATLALYQHKPTEAKLLAVAKSYAEAINSNLKQQTPYPGQYADYGVALAQLGCLEQANIMFNNEKMLFPNSSAYIDCLKTALTPTFSNDNRIDTSSIDLHTLDTIPVNYTPEEEALRRQQADDPEFKRMMKEQAREERRRQAEINKKARAEREKARRAQREAERAAKAAEKAMQDSITRAQKQIQNQ